MRQAGFTLIELLVAMTMLALVTAGVATCLSTGLTAWGRGATAAERELPWVALEQLAQEIAAIPGGDTTRAFLIATDDEQDGLPADTLVASSACGHTEAEQWQAHQVAAGTADQPDWAPVPTREQIEYALNQGDTPGLYWRSIGPAGTDAVDHDTEWELISPDVVGLDFEWYDGTDWQAEWDTTTRSTGEDRLPQAVRITMTIRDEKGNETELTTAAPLGARFDTGTSSAQ